MSSKFLQPHADSPPLPFECLKVLFIKMESCIKNECLIYSICRSLIFEGV